MKKHAVIFILSLWTLVFAACNSDVVREEIVDLPDETWNKEKAVECEFEIDDVESYYTLVADVRNTTDYPYRNLYCFLDITLPDGKVSRDTVQFILAAPSGEWYGTGRRLKDRGYYFAADSKFVATTRQIKGYVPYSVATFSGQGKHPFRFEPLIVPLKVKLNGNTTDVTECYPVKVKFPQKGKYKFSFRQAMRETDLKGMASFGLSVRRYNEDALTQAIQKENKRRLKKFEEQQN